MFFYIEGLFFWVKGGLHMKTTVSLFFVIALLMISVLYAHAENEAVDYAMVLKRLERLERENAVLKDEISALKMGKTVHEGKSAVTRSNKEINAIFYGFIQTDMVYEDDSVPAYVMTYMASLNEQESDDFGICAGGSRFGFSFDGTGIGEDIALSGKLEADFQGESISATADKSFRLRQAYVQADKGNLSFLLGKAWNFIAPFNPGSLTGTALWYIGNIGHRKDQAILSYKPHDSLKLQVGLIDSETGSATNFNHPILGTYMTYECDLLKLGLGGFYANEEVLETGDKSKMAGISGGIKAKVTDKVELKAEGYIGRNMDTFLTGGYSVNGIYDGEPIKNRGGFAQVSFFPWNKTKIVVGSAIDDVYTDDIVDETIWDYNFTWFANFSYQLTSNYVYGFEYQRLETRYFDEDKTKADTNRVMFSNRYTF